MLNKNDKLIHAKLYSPHKSDFVWEREDGTRYIHRKLDKEGFFEIYKNPENPEEWLVGDQIEQ